MSTNSGKNKPNGSTATAVPATYTESYPPTHYLVPGQDAHGHRVRVYCNIRPDVDHEINAIMQSKKWPFRVKGDFIRYAIYDTVKRLEKQKPVPDSLIMVAETINEACKMAVLWEIFNKSLDTLESSVKSFMNSGNEEEALKLLSTTRSNVQKMEEAVWRENYLKELDKRFGHIWTRHKERTVKFNQATRVSTQ